MGYTDIEKLKNELVSYVSDHKDDYHEIFKLHDGNKYKSLHKDFCDFFCSKVKKCNNFNDSKISSSIDYYKDLFYKISKCGKLSKHHKVCTATVSVCLASISKCCKNNMTNKNNTCIVDNSFESTCDKVSSSENSYSFKEGSVCKLSGKSSSSECKKVSTSCNEIIYNKKCKSDDHSDKSSESNNCKKEKRDCDPCENICDSDEPYPFENVDGCAQGNGEDISGEGDCDDLVQITKMTERLKLVLKQLCMLISILCEMQKAFVEKMNCFGVCDMDCLINCIDIDYQNKLMYVLFKQIESLVTRNNCVFNGTKDTQLLKVYLSCGKTLPVIIIDNVKFTFVQQCGKNYILVNIGSKQYKLWFLGECMTNSAAICVLKKNLCTIKLILYALTSNKKMILHWLNVSKRMISCNEIYDNNDKQDYSCNVKSKCNAW
jgi:hypothetical protein